MFYDLCAAAEPPKDPEAELRFRKAFRLAEVAPGERVLDVGAKWGGLGDCARRLGLQIEYTGLDLSEENIRKATSRGLDVRRADVSEPLPLADGAVDCVFCLELLEHVPAAVELLCEMRRVLRPDGRLVVSVPNPYNWVEVYRELFGRPDPMGHLNGFTTPVMTNVLALAGLRLERRLGTSVRVPRTQRIVPTNSIMARSRLYLARPSARVVFAGREMEAPTDEGHPSARPS